MDLGAASQEHPTQPGNPCKKFGFVLKWHRNHWCFLSFYDKEANAETRMIGPGIQNLYDPGNLFWRIPDFQSSVNFDRGHGEKAQNTTFDGFDHPTDYSELQSCSIVAWKLLE